MNPVIPVFISSPEDVGDERKLTESTVYELARRLARLFGVTVVPPRTTPDPPDGKDAA